MLELCEKQWCSTASFQPSSIGSCTGGSTCATAEPDPDELAAEAEASAGSSVLAGATPMTPETTAGESHPDTLAPTDHFGTLLAPTPAPTLTPTPSQRQFNDIMPKLNVVSTAPCQDRRLLQLLRAQTEECCNGTMPKPKCGFNGIS